MKRLLELAELIKNTELRNKTIELLRDPTPSHHGWKVEGIALERAPASANLHHSYCGGLLEHTLSVARIGIAICDVLKEVHNVEVDKDTVIASCLIHDIMKPMVYEENEGTANTSKLNHLLLATLELYKRDFPAGVVHAVAAHHGKGSPVKPGTLEALAVHLADSLDAELNNEVIEAGKKIAALKLKELGISPTPEALKIVFEKASPFAIVQSHRIPGESSTFHEISKPPKKK